MPHLIEKQHIITDTLAFKKKKKSSLPLAKIKQNRKPSNHIHSESAFKSSLFPTVSYPMIFWLFSPFLII